MLIARLEHGRVRRVAQSGSDKQSQCAELAHEFFVVVSSEIDTESITELTQESIDRGGSSFRPFVVAHANDCFT